MTDKKPGRLIPIAAKFEIKPKLSLDERHRPQRIVIGDDTPPPRRNRRPAGDLVAKVLREIWPLGVPPRGEISVPNLIKRVRARGIKASRETIMREAWGKRWKR